MSNYTATATIDLGAIEANVRRIGELTDAAIMTAVKADAYGHGLIPVAKAALAGGATWLGTAQLSEALAIRSAGITAPILAWLFTPHSTLIEECVREGIDLSAPDVWALDLIARAGKQAGVRARVHLEVDTGMGRGGVRLPDFTAVARAARAAEADGALEVVGLWTHLACADEPGRETTTAAQYADFDRALAVARREGLTVRVRHIANSAATLRGLEPYDLVRPGLACYGLSPLAQSPAELGLTPALRLTSELATIKAVPAGAGVSYGHTYTTDRETRIGVVPLGYGDGIPRHASNHVSVLVNGTLVPLVGRVCMDQFMVDLGELEAAPGDEVILFGDGSAGEPTAHDWAEGSGTINYEIVTRLGSRIPRTYRRPGDTGPASQGQIPLPSAEATVELGRQLASHLRPGDLVILTGDLGAGKTTLTKGIGQGLGVQGPISSPTFIIARHHPGPVPLIHVDAYRLQTLAEVDDLDLDSDLSDSITVVEWGKGLAESLAEDRLEISLTRPRGADSHGRYATIHAVGTRWEGVDLTGLAAAVR